MSLLFLQIKANPNCQTYPTKLFEIKKSQNSKIDQPYVVKKNHLTFSKKFQVLEFYFENSHSNKNNICVYVYAELYRMLN